MKLEIFDGEECVVTITSEHDFEVTTAQEMRIVVSENTSKPKPWRPLPGEIIGSTVDAAGNQKPVFAGAPNASGVLADSIGPVGADGDGGGVGGIIYTRYGRQR